MYETFTIRLISVNKSRVYESYVKSENKELPLVLRCFMKFESEYVVDGKNLIA
jgi:hypothetical protein